MISHVSYTARSTAGAETGATTLRRGGHLTHQTAALASLPSSLKLELLQSSTNRVRKLSRPVGPLNRTVRLGLILVLIPIDLSTPPSLLPRLSEPKHLAPHHQAPTRSPRHVLVPRDRPKPSSQAAVRLERGNATLARGEVVELRRREGAEGEGLGEGFGGRKAVVGLAAG